jgi:hypothetical protein
MFAAGPGATTKHAKGAKGLSTKRGRLVDEPFVFNLGIVPEVDQQAQLFSGRLQIVDDLRPMLVRQRVS